MGTSNRAKAKRRSAEKAKAKRRERLAASKDAVTPPKEDRSRHKKEEKPEPPRKSEDVTPSPKKIEKESEKKPFPVVGVTVGLLFVLTLFTGLGLFVGENYGNFTSRECEVTDFIDETTFNTASCGSYRIRDIPLRSIDTESLKEVIVPGNFYEFDSVGLGVLAPPTVVRAEAIYDEIVIGDTPLVEEAQSE